MTSTDYAAGAERVRPKSLSARSLLRRAALGLLILTLGTLASVWLYAVSIQADAAVQPTEPAAITAAPQRR